MLTQRIRPEAPIPVECIALVPSELRRRFAYFSVARSPPDASRAKQHAVERVGDAIPSQRVGGGSTENPRLVIGRVRYAVARSGDGAPVQDAAAERERAGHDVVLHPIVHLVPVLDVYSRTPNVVKHIALDGGGVGRVDDNPALMTPLDRVVLEQARRTIGHHVEMEAVLPFDAWIK